MHLAVSSLGIYFDRRLTADDVPTHFYKILSTIAATRHVLDLPPISAVIAAHFYFRSRTRAQQHLTVLALMLMKEDISHFLRCGKDTGLCWFRPCRNIDSL
jgi:hypothetical protein